MELEMRGLTKRFGSFTANDDITLTIEPGEIHCLLGENGVARSTLMNMLYGLLEPTEGEIVLDGSPVTFASPVTRSRRASAWCTSTSRDPGVHRREHRARSRADPRSPRRPRPGQGRRPGAGSRSATSSPSTPTR